MEIIGGSEKGCCKPREVETYNGGLMHHWVQSRQAQAQSLLIIINSYRIMSITTKP